MRRWAITAKTESHVCEQSPAAGNYRHIHARHSVTWSSGDSFCCLECDDMVGALLRYDMNTISGGTKGKPDWTPDLQTALNLSRAHVTDNHKRLAIIPL